MKPRVGLRIQDFHASSVPPVPLSGTSEKPGMTSVVRRSLFFIFQRRKMSRKKGGYYDKLTLEEDSGRYAS